MNTTRILIKGTLLGLLLALALGPARSLAGTTSTNYYTNYWVQTVNFTLIGYVQSGPNLLSGSLPTKQFISFLSGITNPAFVRGTNYAVSAEVTNSIFLPANAFPSSFVVTNDYVLSANGSSYTNNVSFTNAIMLTETTNNPVTYVFANAVAVASNVTAYIFPDLAASQATAVLVTTNGPGTVFSLAGTNAQGTVLYGTNPDFTKEPGAKVLCKTPIVATTISSGTNAGTTIATGSPTFVIRYGSGKNQVDTPIDAFLGPD